MGICIQDMYEERLSVGLNTVKRGYTREARIINGIREDVITIMELMSDITYLEMAKYIGEVERLKLKVLSVCEEKYQEIIKNEVLKEQWLKYEIEVGTTLTVSIKIVIDLDKISDEYDIEIGVQKLKELYKMLDGIKEEYLAPYIKG